MDRSSFVKSACVALSVLCLGSPQASAIEIVQGSKPGASFTDDMVTKVVVVRRGVARGPNGGVYRHGGVYGHGGVYRGGAYRGGVYRGGAVVRPGYRYHGGFIVGGWARPGWYRWGPGGAIAAGAAIGVIGAAAAAAYAGAPPAPGLCWYYTDPSYRQGFWDACQ